MAVETEHGHEAMDYDEHKRTYALFVKGTIWLTVLSAVVLILLGIFVA